MALTDKKETEKIHEKVKKYFKPVEGGILIEFVKNLKSSGGLYLPETSDSTKSIAHPILAIGSKVDCVKPGEWISLRPNNIDIFPLYGRYFSIVRDFDILMVVDMAYLKDEQAFKQLKAAEEEAEHKIRLDIN
jgi:co-chaperonin GroES (HSP10)